MIFRWDNLDLIRVTIVALEFDSNFKKSYHFLLLHSRFTSLCHFGFEHENNLELIQELITSPFLCSMILQNLTIESSLISNGKFFGKTNHKYRGMGQTTKYSQIKVMS